jgi:hypothetical protein
MVQDALCALTASVVDGQVLHGGHLLEKPESQIPAVSEANSTSKAYVMSEEKQTTNCAS